MRTYAAEIAAKLQDAHERRTRREDEDMSESEAAKVAGRLQKSGAATSSVWDDEALASKVAEVVHATVVEALAGHRTTSPPAAYQAAAERVQELERQLAEAQEAYRQVVVRGETVDLRVAALENDLAAARYNAESFREQAENASKAHQDALARIEELEPFLAVTPCVNPFEHEALRDAYVAREVPWTDVAAGMMTIARDGTPWMVQHWVNEHVMLMNGQQVFEKTPAMGETVRVLVPYVTPEQAEALVKSELGGRA